jgi:hypothetical protein
MRELLEKEKQNIEERLEVFNDPRFSFDEPSHTYHYSGVKFDSVTTFLKNFKEPFNRDYWIKEKSRQRGVDPSVIENEWTEASVKSTRLGNKVHKWIEDFWTNMESDLPEDPDVLSRVEKFLNIYESKFKNLLPLKSELKIFSKKWRLAGTIDQPFLMWDSKKNKAIILIGDWKTNKEFKDDNHPKGRYKKLLRPFNTLFENHHNEYSIQISIYRIILEDVLGIETESGFLVHIGPDGPAKIFPAKDLRQTLRLYLDQNRVDFEDSPVDKSKKSVEDLDIFSLD